jgi:dienelactone hydrolase
MWKTSCLEVEEQIVSVDLGAVQLQGELVIPKNAEGIVIFVYSNGCTRYSTRCRYLAHLLRQAGLATIVIDWLTKEEDIINQRSRHHLCSIRYLASRLVKVTDWLGDNPMTSHLKVGYLGDRTGAGAALLAAAERPMQVGAVVSRSGHTDLVGTALACVQAPTLLIVGGNDYPFITMNEDALAEISARNKQLQVIPEATHQFQELGALEEVARLAGQWFKRHLSTSKVAMLSTKGESTGSPSSLKLTSPLRTRGEGCPIGRGEVFIATPFLHYSLTPIFT